MKPTTLLLALLVFCALITPLAWILHHLAVRTNVHGFQMENAYIEANGFHIYTVHLDGVEYVMATNDKGGIAIIPKVAP